MISALANRFSPFPSQVVSPSSRQRRASRRLLAAIAANDRAAFCRNLSQAFLLWRDPNDSLTALTACALHRRPFMMAAVAFKIQALHPQQAPLEMADALTQLIWGWPRHSQQSGLDRACFHALLGVQPLSSLPPPQEGSWLAMGLSCDNPELATLLSQQGDAVLGCGPNGESLLHLAVRCDAPTLVDWALEHGCSPNGQDNRGDTPLHNAVVCGKLSLADRLVGAGGNPDAINQDGYSPLSMATGLGATGQAWKVRLLSQKLGEWDALSLPSLPSARL